MSPNSIFALLFMALMIDWLSIGPDDWRDRLAFLLGMPAIRAGWDGSPTDRATIDLASQWIDQIKKTGNATIAQATTAQILGVLVIGIAVYCVGVLMPTKWSNKAPGGLALLTFRKGGTAGAIAGAPPGARAGGRGKRQLNWRLWACAYLLGITAELPSGVVGSVIEGTVDGLTNGVAWLPNFLFGVN